LSGTPRYYAYKQFAGGTGDCANPSGYGVPLAVASAPVIREPAGSADGYYFLCVVAGDTPSIDGSWQKFEHASVRFKRIDSQPPAVPLDYVLEPATGGYHLVNMSGGDVPSGLGPAYYKMGSLAATDCTDSQGYRVQTSIPVTIRTSDFPVRICWQYSDRAGNLTVPAAFDFGPPTIFPNGIRSGASLERGTIAPGSMFRADTFNLTPVSEFSSAPVPTLAGVRASLLDAAGHTLPVNLTTAGPQFIEGLIPDAAAAGAGSLLLQPPQGPALSQPVTIRRGAPGLYFEPNSGAPVGFAIDSRSQTTPLSTCEPSGRCNLNTLRVASTPGGLDVILYGTGFRHAEGVKVRIGTHVIEGVVVLPHPEIAGVDEAHFHLGPEFSLHLYQAISIETAEAVSPHCWIYLE